MNIPEFKDVEDVQRFLRYGGDEWCRPMVEEYMELIAFDTKPEEIDIEELNGWLEHELQSVTDGDRDWGDDHSGGNRGGTRDTEPASTEWFSNDGR